MNKTCEQNGEQLLAFLMDELGTEAREEIVSHLASCEVCKAELESLRSTIERLQHEFKTPIEEPRLSPERIAELKSGKVRIVPAPISKPRRDPWTWGAWAALALFGLLGALMLIRPGGEKSAARLEIAQVASEPYGSEKDSPGPSEAIPTEPSRPENFRAMESADLSSDSDFSNEPFAREGLIGNKPQDREFADAAPALQAVPMPELKKEESLFEEESEVVGDEVAKVARTRASPEAIQEAPRRMDAKRANELNALEAGTSGQRQNLGPQSDGEFSESDARRSFEIDGNEGPDSLESRRGAPERSFAGGPDVRDGRIEEQLASAPGSDLRNLRSIAPSPEPAPQPSLPNDEKLDAMVFQNYGVNPFIDTAEDSRSTFAVDVDTASYTIVRGYLDRGLLPPPEAVRVEEFVNYFRAEYPDPASQVFAVYSEVAPSPFRQGTTLLRIGIKGREISPSDRKPVILTFVVDVSGSMAREDRLGLVKRTLGMLLRELRPGDRVGLAVYGSQGREILPHVDVTDEGAIERGIQQLVTGGSTNAEEGLRIGYAMARRAFDPEAVNRVLLCSDGVANVGRTGADSILEVIGREANDQIYLTALGFGLGNYNDVLLEQLANKGNGHYAYLDTDAEALEFIRRRLSGSMEVIAQDVKVQVELDPEQVRQYRLLGYENRDVADRDFRNDRVDAGEIGAGHTVTALYELKLNNDAPRGDLGVVRLRFKDPDRGLTVREIEGELDFQPYRSRFEDADRHFRLVWVAAQFAEILRGSYWARDYRVEDLARLLESEPVERIVSDQRDELLRMMRTAERLLPEERIEPIPMNRLEDDFDDGRVPPKPEKSPGRLEMKESGVPL